MEDAHIGVLNLQQQTERPLVFEPCQAQAFFGVRAVSWPELKPLDIAVPS